MNLRSQERVFRSELMIPVRGTSMSPGFIPGDNILVRWNKHYSPEIGDIIYFKQTEEWVFHRVIDNQDGQLITKGDRSLYLDMPIIGLMKGVVVGKSNSRSTLYWGLGGQRYKRWLAICSRMRQENHLRVIRCLGLLGIWLLLTLNIDGWSNSRHSVGIPKKNL